MYLTGEAFKFYYEKFTYESGPSEETKSFRIVKNLMLDRFSPRKSEFEVMKEALNS